MATNITLTINELKECMRRALTANQTPIAWGPPGCGKSESVYQVGEELKFDSVSVIHAATFDAVDLRGLPYVEGKGATKDSKWAIPDFLPKKGKVLLFLDELDRGIPSVQNALLRLIRERRLGDYAMPEECRIVAACNGAKHSSGTNATSSAMNNRLLHYYVEPDLDSFCMWAFANGIVPQVIAFLRRRPEFLSKYEKGDLAFPSPRSWSYMSDLAKIPQTNEKLCLADYSAAVGYGVASEYFAFERMAANLPSIDEIFLDPQNTPVPNDPSGKYAVAAAIAHAMKDTNINRAIQYLERMPVEFNVMSMKDAVTRERKLAGTSDFTKWGLAHSDVII